MSITCEIEFENNPFKVIYAGQLLRGTIRLGLTEEKTICGIFVKLSGKAYALWTQGCGDKRKTYTGKEEYLNAETCLVGGRDGKHNEIIINSTESFSRF